jgi:hypothetical protein
MTPRSSSLAFRTMGRASGLVPVAVAAALVASPCAAFDPPRADTVGAVAARVGQTVEILETIAAGIGLDGEALRKLAPCEPLATSRGESGQPGVCAEGLVQVHAELGRRRSGTSDPLIRAATDRAAAQVSGTVSLLAWLEADASAGGPDRALAPRGRDAGIVLLAEDDRSIAVEPLRALRAGREYALVLEAPESFGEPPATLATREEEQRLNAERFAGATAGPALEKVAAFVADLAASDAAAGSAAAPRADFAPFASVRLTLARPIESADLRSLRAYFVAARDAPRSGVVARFRTVDARTGMADARSELRSESCPPVELQSLATPVGTTVPALYGGQTETLDLAAASAATPTPALRAGPAETPALADQSGATPSPSDDGEAPRRAALDLLVAVPTGLGDATPLVVALDGHQGSARRVLARHGADLLARGLAVLSFDLPGHGTRTAEGDFVVANEPARLTRGMRQGAVDVLASVRAAVVCGFRLPDGRSYRPRSVRFLGYSLGAMVGALARAVEPDLGTTVFLAPGGDLFGWLMLRLGPALGARFVACLGGPEHGASCIEDGACAPPGRCIVDPFFQGLHETIERAYRQATALGDPLSFATRRTGETSHGRLLLVTGGNDAVLYPGLASRLADAYGMHVVGPHRRRGPRSALVQWPQLGHDLHQHPDVRRQADEFLASDGRRILPAALGTEPDAPGWYRVFGSSRR